MKYMQTNNLDFIKFLEEHKNKKTVSFHMPGHKGMRFFEKNGYSEFFGDVASADITEIDGADNLFKPEGIIKSVMEQYKKLYGSRASYLLVNGSSSGIETAILASVKYGGKLILARNSHKSIYNAIELGNLNHVYAMPQIDEKYGIVGQISAAEIERLLTEHEDAEAVVIPSPNYYGICSDIAAIASSCHAHGKILIIDEAHGAHLKFFADFARGAKSGKEFPAAAEGAGADIVIVSTHKTLASFTQSAVLNVMSERVALDALCERLGQFTSTSPSYLLMASLAINAAILEENGELLMRQWLENLDFFYEHAQQINGLDLLTTAGKSKSGFELLDKSKLNLDMSAFGYNGYELQQALIEYGIYTELASGNLVMCMTGIGNERSDYEKLLDALMDIAEKRKEHLKGTDNYTSKILEREKVIGRSLPDRMNTDGMRKIRMNLKEAQGKASAVHIIPYPPGVPLVCPHEVLSKELIDEILLLINEGEKVLGVDGNLQIVCYQ